jgi:hypothetical protein
MTTTLLQPPRLNPFENKQWQRGGMQSNGLRQAGEVRNYFRTPGRMNIIPDASYYYYTPTSNDKLFPNKFVTSIGEYQTSANKQVASGTYGPGTLESSNIQVRFSQIPNELNIGSVHQNEKRTEFVDYRHTAPWLVDQLRHECPLSIYATGDAKNKEIPAFFTYVQPDNYATYKSSPKVPISKYTIDASINGSPQANILGLAHQNPLMGITSDIPNQEPEFKGKTYGGGKTGDAKPYAWEIYKQGYYDPYQGTTETFSASAVDPNAECYNKALNHFSPGYNVAPQVRENKMIAYVGNERTGQQAVNNLPWGPINPTGNPLTQQGGVWQRGQNPWPTTSIHDDGSYRNTPATITQIAGGDPERNTLKLSKCDLYNSGLPGSLICSS